MKVIRRVAAQTGGQKFNLVVVQREHSTTPYIVTIEANGVLAVEQNPAMGIYCLDLRAANTSLHRI